MVFMLADNILSNILGTLSRPQTNILIVPQPKFLLLLLPPDHSKCLKSELCAFQAYAKPKEGDWEAHNSALHPKTKKVSG